MKRRKDLNNSHSKEIIIKEVVVVEVEVLTLDGLTEWQIAHLEGNGEVPLEEVEEDQEVDGVEDKCQISQVNLYSINKNHNLTKDMYNLERKSLNNQISYKILNNIYNNHHSCNLCIYRWAEVLLSHPLGLPQLEKKPLYKIHLKEERYRSQLFNLSLINNKSNLKNMFTERRAWINKMLLG